MRKILLLLLGAALVGAVAMLAINMLFRPAPPSQTVDPRDWQDGADLTAADPFADAPVEEKQAAPGTRPPAAARPIEEMASAGDSSEDSRAAKLCRGDLSTEPGTTLFGHRRFGQPGGGALTSVPAGFGSGGCQQIHRDMADALKRLLDAAEAEDPALRRDMMGISCYRSIERQAAIFCNPARIESRGYAGQAFSVAPPGYSEHSTGFTIDFGSRSESGCNLESCFEGTRVGRWLIANAGRFGFEMSFPRGNGQGVTYEPWHYRWKGSGAAQSALGGG